AAMKAVVTDDPQFQLLASISHYVAGDVPAAVGAAQTAAASPDLASQGHHLLGLLNLRNKDNAEARAALVAATQAADTTARDHAWAVLGQLAGFDGDFAEALRCWQAVPRPQRAAWKIDTLFAAAGFLAGVAALREGQFGIAADWFRTSGAAGFRHSRLPA